MQAVSRPIAGRAAETNNHACYRYTTSEIIRSRESNPNLVVCCFSVKLTASLPRWTRTSFLHFFDCSSQPTRFLGIGSRCARQGLSPIDCATSSSLFLHHERSTHASYCVWAVAVWSNVPLVLRRHAIDWTQPAWLWGQGLHLHHGCDPLAFSLLRTPHSKTGIVGGSDRHCMNRFRAALR